jgi:hypothetical protein
MYEAVRDRKRKRVDLVVCQLKKRDLRLWIDFRCLNAITVKNKYPMSLIKGQIDLGDYKYLTMLDLASGYYQAPMDAVSMPKTGFVTSDGHYEFLRMHILSLSSKHTLINYLISPPPPYRENTRSGNSSLTPRNLLNFNYFFYHQSIISKRSPTNKLLLIIILLCQKLMCFFHKSARLSWFSQTILTL